MSLYTEKQLGEALRGIMRRKDLDSVTVTGLTEARRMNRKTFYHHFDGMDALARGEALARLVDRELLAALVIGIASEAGDDLAPLPIRPRW